jgi:hypothetical protein
MSIVSRATGPAAKILAHPGRGREASRTPGGRRKAWARLRPWARRRAGDGNRGAACAGRAPRSQALTARCGRTMRLDLRTDRAWTGCPRSAVVYWPRDPPARTPEARPVRAAPPTPAHWTWPAKCPRPCPDPSPPLRLDRLRVARPVGEGAKRTTAASRSRTHRRYVHDPAACQPVRGCRSQGIGVSRLACFGIGGIRGAGGYGGHRCRRSRATAARA